MATEVAPKAVPKLTALSSTLESVDELLSALDVLEAHPRFLHVANADDLDVPALSSAADEALATLRRSCTSSPMGCSSHHRRAIEAGLAYAGYALDDVRQNLAAGLVPAVVAAQLADGVQALRMVRDECAAAALRAGERFDRAPA
jgi:hypothetical protein